MFGERRILALFTSNINLKNYCKYVIKYVYRNDHKMALVQLDDVDKAINALTEMHNYKLADNAHLRVSFSKKGLSV